MLAVELANRESRSSWRDFLLRLKARGLQGVEFVVADDHAGLRAALREVLAEGAYQRCYEMLKGVRGADPVDRAALADMLEKLSRLVSDSPEIAELDLNPVVATKD